MRMTTLDDEIRKIVTEAMAQQYRALLDDEVIIESAIRAGIRAFCEQEPSEEMLRATQPAFELINSWCAEMQLVRGRVPNWPEDDPPLKQAYRAMMAVALKELK